MEFKLLGVAIDLKEDNFKYDTSGNLVYVDTPIPWFSNTKHLNYDAKKIRFALNNLKGPERDTALTYLDRLEALTKAESENFGKK